MKITESPSRDQVLVDLVASDIQKLCSGERLPFEDSARHLKAFVLPLYEPAAMEEQFKQWGYSRGSYQPGLMKIPVRFGFAIPYEGRFFSPQDEPLNGGTERIIDVYLPHSWSRRCISKILRSPCSALMNSVLSRAKPAFLRSTAQKTQTNPSSHQNSKRARTAADQSVE